MAHGPSTTHRGLLPAAAVVQETDAGYQTRLCVQNERQLPLPALLGLNLFSGLGRTRRPTCN
jgi:hypothetical protein